MVRGRLYLFHLGQQSGDFESLCPFDRLRVCFEAQAFHQAQAGAVEKLGMSLVTPPMRSRTARWVRKA